MKAEIVRALTDNFEVHTRHTEAGVEFWLHLSGTTHGVFNRVLIRNDM